MRILWIIVFISTLCTAAFAQDLSSSSHSKTTKSHLKPFPKKEAPKEDQTLWVKKYVFNLGSHTEFFNAVQSDASGGIRQFDFSPTIGGGLYIPLKNDYLFLPEVNWVLPKNGLSDKVIKNLFMLRGDFGYNPIEWFRVRLGTSFMWLNQHGRGGSTSVNNGNGSSTFFYPNENHSSLNNTIDVGGEFLWDDWAVRLQTYTYALFHSERRQLSYTLFVSYYWDR